MAMLLNEAMKAERNRTLGAGNYERTENRKEKMYLYFLRRKSPLTIREIAGITNMKPVTTGALIRRFSREIVRKTTLKKDKKKIEKLIEKQREYIENEA